MTKRIWNLVLVLACLLGIQSAHAEFKDFKLNLEGVGLLTADEVSGNSTVSFGIVVNADGTLSRVADNDASADAIFSGTYHSEHGCTGAKLVFAVDGPVKIGLGTCVFGTGDATAKNTAGEVVATLNSNNGACFHGDRVKNVVYGFYKGEATTLTLEPKNYTPYISVEKADPSEIVEEVAVSFGFGDYADSGILPQEAKIEIGKTFTIPANYTMFVSGKTLVSWTDGSKNYELGEVVTVEAPLSLTPVFVDNTVSLADRTEPVTVKWNFRQDQGCPNVSWEGSDGFLVAKAQIGTEVIDVKLDIATSPGKFNSGSNNDWAQINEGTRLTVPACKDAVISFESFNVTTTTTIDGQVINQGSNTPSFTCAGDIENAEIVIGDGSYFRYVQVVLPVVKTGGESFTSAKAEVVWPFDNTGTYAETSTVTPPNAFSITSVDLGGSVTGVEVSKHNGLAYVKVGPTNGASDKIKWFVKPAKGLVFTPTKVRANIARAGTDAKSGMTVTAELEDGTILPIGVFTAHRVNKTQAEDKFGAEPDYADKFEISLTAEQQAKLASSEGFYLCCTHGVNAGKQAGYSDVHIEGLIDGTLEEVERYSLSLAASPAEAGAVSVYPTAEKYDAGSEVSVSSTRNFGYKFVNWTDESGNVVSSEENFKYTVEANAVLTANYQKLTTYSLDIAVDGANDYMVTAIPAGTLVDGLLMYEEGTSVTLSAASNKVFTFTNWSDGQSSSEISVIMDGDKDLTAVYSSVDYLAGWDFVKAGNDGRIADFYAADNDAVALVLRNADGSTSGWLDKSLDSDKNGYEGRPGAVNWRTTGLGEYYWQTMVNAAAFTDLKVITSMVFNFNAYTKYNVEYSLDGEVWKPVGVIAMEGPKSWTDGEFSLPAEANNQPAVHIRWIADKNSDIMGTQSSNDGACLGASFIVGKAKLVDDGVPPVLLSSVPAENSETASINGKIVLTFDEKVKVKEGVKASLGNLSLEPSVTGKTVLFQYKNLVYGTKYTFSLPANSIMDLTDNAISDPITFSFTTKTRPVIAKALYDAEVSTVDELVEAIKNAGTRADKSKRFRIFIHDGEYKLPASETATKNGSDGKTYPDPTTYINVPNISFIGESMDGVVITNTVPKVEGDNGFGAANVLEGIGNGDVMDLNSDATGTYFQDLTMKSSMGDNRGRDIVLNDKSNKTIAKNVCLWAYQDTYVSNNERARFYFEGGVLRGRTDFLCGKGDVYYNAVTLQMCDKGGYLAVPSKPTKYGYIFKDCEIVGEKDGIDGNYTLGRPWGSGTPIALFIDTKMTVKPSAVGWNEMSGGWPARFAEYNSTTAAGTVIDLKDRKKIFADSHANNPVLTKAEADAVGYTVVMGGDDDWDPASHAEQAPAPTNVVIDGNLLSWDDSDYASCWAICKDGKVIAFTIEPSYTVSASDVRESVVYSVRAANEMGGLGEAVVASEQSGISDIESDSEVVSTLYYNIQGIQVSANTPGVLIKVETLSSGATRTSKTVVR